MEEFEVGDVVYLKSGGPKMTIEKDSTSTGGKSFICKWWVGSNEYVNEHNFKAVMLTANDPN